MRKLLFISVMALCPLGYANAALFKCVEDGRVTYQGTPCHGSGSELNIPPEEIAPSSDKGTATDPSAIAARFDEQSKQLGLEHRLRDINYEEQKLAADAAGYQSQMNSELDALQQKKDFWEKQLGGKTQAQAVANEMQSISNKYQPLIKSAQDNLSKLNKEKDSINTQLSAKKNTDKKGEE